MAVFIDLWFCQFTNKLSYALLFKLGHSTVAAQGRKWVHEIFYFTIHTDLDGPKVFKKITAQAQVKATFDYPKGIR